MRVPDLTAPRQPSNGIFTYRRRAVKEVELFPPTGDDPCGPPSESAGVPHKRPSEEFRAQPESTRRGASTGIQEAPLLPPLVARDAMSEFGASDTAHVGSADRVLEAPFLPTLTLVRAVRDTPPGGEA